MMTDEQLADIEERVNSVSKGPWISDIDIFDEDLVLCATVFDDDVSFLAIASTDIVNDLTQSTAEAAVQSQTAKNMVFLAHAREDIPALIAEVKRLRAKLGNIS